MKRGCLYCYSGNMDRAIELFQGFYPDIRLSTTGKAAAFHGKCVLRI